MPLLAVLVPALGALLIACTGERRANLREFWSVAAGAVMAALVASMIPDVLVTTALSRGGEAERNRRRVQRLVSALSIRLFSQSSRLSSLLLTV